MKIAGRNLLDYVAFAISSVFSPYVTAAIFIILIVYTYSQDLNQFFPWMLTFFIFAIVVPGFYILWLLEAKKISDIHMADANARKTPLIVAAISSVAGTAILYFLHAAHPVIVISVIYALNSVVIALITQKWKISVHTGMFASIATIAVVLFGHQSWLFWLLYLVLVPLAWSRIYRKRHTVLQTIFGALVTAILTLIVLYIFHYI
jgi:membrane-associated phospholipid phosphatase